VDNNCKSCSWAIAVEYICSLMLFVNECQVHFCSYLLMFSRSEIRQEENDSRLNIVQIYQFFVFQSIFAHTMIELKTRISGVLVFH